MTQEYVMPPPSAEKLAKVLALVKDMRAKEVELETLEADVSDKKLKLKELTHTQIPDLMREMGLTELPVGAGNTLVIMDKISASIPKERSEAAIKWLEDNGQSGLIKRVVSIAFNRDQAKEAAALVKRLQPKFAGLQVDAWVEPMTLKKFVGDTLKAGKVELPKELLGVHRFDEAVVKEPKAKKKVFEGE